MEKHVGIICSNLFQDLRGSLGALMVRKRKQESAKAQGAGIVVLTKLQTTLLTSALQKEHLKVGIQKNPARIYVDVSENSGTPKSSHFNRFSIINHPFWGTPIIGNIHLCTHFLQIGDASSPQPHNWITQACYSLPPSH